MEDKKRIIMETMNGEEITEETIKELSNNRGDDEENEQ